MFRQCLDGLRERTRTTSHQKLWSVTKRSQKRLENRSQQLIRARPTRSHLDICCWYASDMSIEDMSVRVRNDLKTVDFFIWENSFKKNPPDKHDPTPATQTITNRARLFERPIHTRARSALHCTAHAKSFLPTWSHFIHVWVSFFWFKAGNFGGPQLAYPSCRI